MVELLLGLFTVVLFYCFSFYEKRYEKNKDKILKAYETKSAQNKAKNTGETPVILVLFLIIFINMLGFGIIIPLTPALKVKFALNAVQVGILGGIFPLMQVISSPILGAISDKVGRKPVIVISFIIASSSYIILALATSYPILILSRVVGGFFFGSFVVAMACASDLSSKEKRMKYMGITGMAFGLGFMLGPAVGGFLAGNNLHSANIVRTALVAFVIMIISIFFTIKYLPETFPHIKREKSNSFALIKKLFTNTNTSLNFTLTGILSLILSGTEIFVSIWLAEKFNFSPVFIGLFWTFYAIMMNIGRILFSRNVKGYYGVLGFFLVIGAAFLGFVFTNTIFFVFLFTTFMALSAGVLITVINTKVSLHGGAGQQGLLLGVNNAAGNFGRFIGPYIIGLVWHKSGNIHVSWATLSFITLFAVGISAVLARRDKKV